MDIEKKKKEKKKKREKKKKKQKIKKKEEGIHSIEKIELNFQSNNYIYHGLMIIFKVILIMARGDNYL